MIRSLRVALYLLLFWILGNTSFALDRNAFTFTHYDLHARVVPAEQTLEVQGRVTLRNDSPVPQRFVSLQVSSSLAWKTIRAGGKALAFVADTYTTDIDHTGAVSEAIITLPGEIAPKGTVDLDVGYAGVVSADATRLTRIGAPAALAAHNDWDEISTAFTGVRGVGYVCWYPVSLDALSLSEGARLFQVLGEWKQRHAASSMHLVLASVSEKPAITNGRLVGQKATAEAEGTVHEREYDFAPLSLVPPTFTIADYTLLSRPALNVFYLPQHQAPAQEYVLAAEKQLPFITDWFGPQHDKVGIVELPAGDAPFDGGAILFTPLAVADRPTVEVAVAHQLAHACIASQRPWIVEGLAHFAQALVRERQQGRKAALGYMQQFRRALVEAEKQALAPNPGDQAAARATGEPLVRATDEIYHRSKAMFVWWMLRDMAGDEALRRTLRSYRAADDKEPSYVQRLLGAQTKKSFEWFFDDWVYRDRGLPDFRIETAYPRPLLSQNYTVTVTVENVGDAAAEVPVVVPLEGGEALARVMVPAHGKAIARVQSPVAPSEVVVNDGSVPESDVSNNTFKIEKAQ